MHYEKMELVNIGGFMHEIDSAIEACCDSGCFHIEPAVRSGEYGSSRFKTFNEKNPYSEPLKLMQKLAMDLNIRLSPADHTKCKFKKASEFLRYAGSIQNKFLEYNDALQTANKEISEVSGAIMQINHLRSLNNDFDKIFACKYVSVRVGRLPSDNLPKLDYYKENFFFVPFEKTDNFCFGMYFCPVKDKAEVDDIFKSLYFERIHIPDYVKGSPEDALEQLNIRLKTNKDIAGKNNGEIDRLAAGCKDEFLQVYSKLKKRHDIFELRKYAGVYENKFCIKGFITSKDKKKFLKLFDDMNTVSVEFMPADSDSANLTPPTKLKNSWLTRPFNMMVEMYGLPEYGGFNPTTFVAITYTLLFGIMFGDLGQGFIIFLLSFIVGKKMNRQAGGILSRVGLSSMLFGTLYGSVFGFEELLDPIYESIGISFLPLKVFKQTDFILITAVAIGVVLIISSMIINIYIGFKQKDYEKAVFGCNGIAGLVFYSSVIFAAVSTLMFDMKVMSPLFVIFMIVIPLICIFCRVPFSIATKYKKWKLSNEDENMTVGGFIVENFFEMFEFLLSYVSNTMSFLRVGGFVLSHAGMMLVVMTLMEGCSAVGKPFVFILGNLFVMAMEGMIVAIQIIRLEFYEMFSRFNESNGKAFEPLKLSFESAEN